MAAALFTLGDTVRLAPDPNYPKAVWSDTEWKIIAVYKNASGQWAVGQVTKGTDVGSQTPLDNPERYEKVHTGIIGKLL